MIAYLPSNSVSSSIGGELSIQYRDRPESSNLQLHCEYDLVHQQSVRQRESQLDIVYTTLQCLADSHGLICHMTPPTLQTIKGSPAPASRRRYICTVYLKRHERTGWNWFRVVNTSELISAAETAC